MRKYFTIIAAIACSYLILTPALAANDREENSGNIKLVTEQYREFLEKKNTSLMSKYIAKNVEFYRNFDSPVYYDSLYKHVLMQNEKCTKLKILPFDQITASGNKVATLYTLSCTDKFNAVHKKRIISIAEIDKNHKVSKFWQVTHDEKEV